MPLPLRDIYSKEVVEGYIFERNVSIPLQTGANKGLPLRANVYRPNKEGQFPVICTIGPYGKDWHYSTFHSASYTAVADDHKGVNDSWETPQTKYWTAHDYVVVRADESGFGQSPGPAIPISDRTVDGFYDLVEWSGQQSWSTGKVGLLGLSYFAGTQWHVAARKPKSLVCMIPWEGWADSYRDLSRHGGIASSGFLKWWWDNSLRGNQYGYPTPEEKPGRPKTLEGVLSDEELAANRVVTPDVAAEQEFVDDPFHAGTVYDIRDIETPFLSVANLGGNGLHLRGNVQGFVHASSKLKYIQFIAGRHDLPLYYPHEVENQLSFLDAFLKGDDRKGWTVPGKVPPVSLLLRKGEPQVGNWDEEAKIFSRRTENEWPLARTEYTKLHLTPDGTLSLDPVTETKVLEYPAPIGSIELSTPPLEKETEVVGHASIRVSLSLASVDGSSPSEIDVFATLRHFNASGEEVFYTGSLGEPTPVTRGWLRASHRALDKSHYQARDYLPFHPHTRSTAQPVERGQIYTLDIELWPTTVVVGKGGRLVLEIAACDNPENRKHPSVGVWTHDDPRDRPVEKLKGLNIIHLGEAHENWLLLPVIPSKNQV